MKTKGQVWTLDFFIVLGLLIAVIFIILKILLSLSLANAQSPTYDDAVHISSELLTVGYPKNWTNETVIIPGIAESNRINATKLTEYKKLSYDNTKMLYHVSSEYLFFFTNGTKIINYSGCTYGYPITTDENCTPIMSAIDYDDLSKIDRIVVLDNKVVGMTVYAWN